MKICMCNRCGKEIQEVNPLTNAYSLTNYYSHFDIVLTKKPMYTFGFALESIDIDLCHDCSLELCNFIFDYDKSKGVEG